MQGAGGGDGFFQGRRGGLLDGGRVGTGQNQHILAAGVVVLIKGHGLAESRLFDLLVQLGQLTAERDRAVRTEGSGQVVQRAAQLVRGLVEDHRAGLVLQKGQPFAAVTLGDGQKALEHKAGRGLAAGRQRRDAGRCRRDGHDPDAALVGLADDLLAGVADAGHTGIAAQGAILPSLDAVQDGLAVVERVLIVADHRLFETQMVEQPQRDAGVLSRDEVRQAEGSRHTRRHVIQIADRRGDKI